MDAADSSSPARPPLPPIQPPVTPVSCPVSPCPPPGHWAAHLFLDASRARHASCIRKHGKQMRHPPLSRPFSLFLSFSCRLSSFLVHWLVPQSPLLCAASPVFSMHTPRQIPTQTQDPTRDRIRLPLPAVLACQSGLLFFFLIRGCANSFLCPSSLRSLVLVKAPCLRLLFAFLTLPARPHTINNPSILACPCCPE